MILSYMILAPFVLRLENIDPQLNITLPLIRNLKILFNLRIFTNHFLKIDAIFHVMTFFIKEFLQATLQFCVVKPVMAVITLFLQFFDLYQDGNWRWETVFFSCLFVLLMSRGNQKLNSAVAFYDKIFAIPCVYALVCWCEKEGCKWQKQCFWSF